MHLAKVVADMDVVLPELSRPEAEVVFGSAGSLDTPALTVVVSGGRLGDRLVHHEREEVERRREVVRFRLGQT